MKIESMRTRSYRDFKVDDAGLPAEARERLSAIRRYDELRAAGCAEQAASREIGVSRRTMYRWKAALAASGQRGLAPKSTRPRRVRRRSCKPSDVKAVLDLRRKHPFMGKAPIQRMLERKGLRLSVSTVGRILSRAIAAGVVPLASICEGRVKPRRRRRFDGWARRWKYGDKADRPGQLVQRAACGAHRPHDLLPRWPDHQGGSGGLFESAPSAPSAGSWSPASSPAPPPSTPGASSTPSSSPSPRPCSPSRSTAAASSCAIHGAPRFEDACRELGIDLRVLPPRRPQWNGHVERANRTARIEFWNFLDCDLTVKAISRKLLEHEFFYNYERPHSALDYLAPNEYLVAREAA